MKFIIKICLEKYAAAVAALLHHLLHPLGPITSFSVSTFLLQKFAFAAAAAESIECTAAAVLWCAVACLIRQVLDVTCLRPYAWYKNCLQVNKKKEMHTPSTVWRAKSLSFQLIPRFDKWNRCMRRRRRRRDELADSRQPWDGMAWGCLVMQSSSFPPSPLNAQVTTTISFSTTPLLFFFFGRSEFTRKQKMTLNN